MTTSSYLKERIAEIQASWQAITLKDEDRTLTCDDLHKRITKANILNIINTLSFEDLLSTDLPMEYHPNGFRRIRLAFLGRNFPQLRIHQFLETKNADIHEHPWNASAYILSGSLLNIEYGLTPGMTHKVLAEWTPQDSGYKFFECGWTKPNVTKMTRLSTGERYCIEEGVYHLTRAKKGTATLFAHAAYGRNVCRVVRRV